MCSSYDDPPQCNRQPFLSESGCDRGSVDIHQFDDLPYCDKIDPTQPDIPPEIVDTPTDMVIPPSCSCVNIDYKLDFKYNSKGKFLAKGEFSAKGDCCEGNYETKFDLQIPCPVDETEGKLRIGISYGSGPQSASASFINADPDSCTIGAGSPNINLNLPCPVEDTEGKLRVGISYGNGPQSASAKFINANHDSCTIGAGNPNINLNLPCPVRESEGKIKIGISYGQGPQSASASFMRADPDGCTIEAGSPRINLNIPCPVDGKDNKFKIGISYGNGAQSASARLIKTNGEKCTIEPENASVNLNIPCPIVGRSATSKIKANIRWGRAKIEPVSFLKTDVSNCTIEGFDTDLNLNIGCPLEKLKFNTEYKTAEGSKGDLVVEEVSYSSVACQRNIKITASIPDFKLDVPCPIKEMPEGNKVKIGISYVSSKSESQSASASIMKTDIANCTIIPVAADFRLHIPCPIRTKPGKKKIKARIKYGSNEGDERSSVSASFANKGESCSLSLYGDADNEVSLKLRIGCPIKTGVGKKKIKARIKYGSNKGDEKSSVSVSYASKGQSCSVALYDVINIPLRIRCPIISPDKTGWRKFKIKTKLGSHSSSNSLSLLKVDSSSCKLEFIPETTQSILKVPCPVFKKGKLKLRFKVPQYKYENEIMSSSVSLVSFDSKKCEIRPSDDEMSHSFEMKIPCPTTEDRLSIETSFSMGTSASPDPSFHASSSFINESCRRHIVFKLKFPYRACKDYVVGIRYNASKHALQYKTYNPCNPNAKETWKDIFTAVAHMTDHTCCNDV